MSDVTLRRSRILPVRLTCHRKTPCRRRLGGRRRPLTPDRGQPLRGQRVSEVGSLRRAIPRRHPAAALREVCLPAQLLSLAEHGRVSEGVGCEMAPRTLPPPRCRGGPEGEEFVVLRRISSGWRGAVGMTCTLWTLFLWKRRPAGRCRSVGGAKRSTSAEGSRG